MKKYVLIAFVFLNLTLKAQLKQVESIDDSGKIIEIGYLNENNNKDSVWYTYNENGILVAETEYKDGKKSGVWRLYNDEGDLMFKVFYVDGLKREGKQWDDKGRLIDYRKWDSKENLVLETIRKY